MSKSAMKILDKFSFVCKKCKSEKVAITRAANRSNVFNPYIDEYLHCLDCGNNVHIKTVKGKEND